MEIVTPVIQQLIDILVLVLGAAASIGSAYAIQFIRSKIKNDDFASSLDLTIKVVENSVRDSIQVMGSEAKKAVADGNISSQDIKNIQNAAKHQVVTQVAPKMQKRLESHLGDISEFIKSTTIAELQKADKVTS
jgi:SepF-like predicted cell division protein (DUF552 family)